MAERDKTGLEPFFGGSVTLEYSLTPLVFLYLKGDFSAIYETTEIQPWAGAQIGAGLNL